MFGGALEGLIREWCRHKKYCSRGRQWEWGRHLFQTNMTSRQGKGTGWRDVGQRGNREEEKGQRGVVMWGGGARQGHRWNTNTEPLNILSPTTQFQLAVTIGPNLNFHTPHQILCFLNYCCDKSAKAASSLSFNKLSCSHPSTAARRFCWTLKRYPVKARRKRRPPCANQ